MARPHLSMKQGKNMGRTKMEEKDEGDRKISSVVTKWWGR